VRSRPGDPRSVGSLEHRRIPLVIYPAQLTSRTAGSENSETSLRVADTNGSCHHDIRFLFVCYMCALLCARAHGRVNTCLGHRAQDSEQIAVLIRPQGYCTTKSDRLASQPQVWQVRHDWVC